ncbi:MAG: DUF3368 domain-containing protein [Kiritimatiellae bacterium]|nr:DUF3368 domain-containing protein [Kiritimatiellia bacterium]
MRVVVNTSPFIALARIGELAILHQLYGTVVRPQSVLDELHAGVEQHGLDAELTDAEWIVTEPDPPEMILRKELGDGETAVITLALKTNADLVVLDDLQARLVAQSLSLKLTGTLGILCAAHRTGLLADLADAIRRLREAGFRISEELVQALLGSNSREADSP